MEKLKRIKALLPLALALVVIAALACSSSNEEDVAALRSDVEALKSNSEEEVKALRGDVETLKSEVALLKARLPETQTPAEVPAHTPTPIPEKVSVSLALDWFPNSNHIGLFIAQEKGYFEDEGLEVDLYTPVDPSTVLLTVGAGRDDFGISYQPDVLLARAQGVPVVSIAGIVQHPLNSIMTLKSSGLTTPKDLIGKKVGYPGIPTNEGLLDTMLKTDGAGGLDDVELVNVGFDLVPALISGTVDAIIGAYWTHESIVMENLGHPVNIMRAEQFGVPDYYELVMVASEDTIANRPDIVERFMRAVRKGFNEAVADPQAGVDLLLQGAKGEVDEAVERPGADLLQPMWKTSDADFGEQTAARWTNFAKWMQDNGLLDSDVSGSDAFTDKFQGQ